ncbi:MAG: hypothetical protein IBX55_16120 [Methyloprofundus sp.]|nr:hypothetical protein [Methyloprofundus sp.]
MSFQQQSKNLVWYLHEWAFEFETLNLEHLENYGLPAEIADLLNVLIEDAKALQEDDENKVYPNSELKSWFIELVDRSHSWLEIEEAIRTKLIDDCRVK